MEFLYRIFGFRKAGLLGKYSTRPNKPVFGRVPIKKESKRKEINLSGGYEVNQGSTPSCACATIVAMALDNAIVTSKNKSISIDWKPMWNSMVSLGLAGPNGSYLEDNIWFMQNHGVRDNSGNLWKIDVVEKIRRSNIENCLRMGYQVYTGDMIGRPMCDKNWVFRNVFSTFGHCFRAIGITEMNGHKLLMETTWKNYGYKKESQFFYEPDKTTSLMSCYVMTFKKVN